MYNCCGNFYNQNSNYNRGINQNNLNFNDYFDEMYYGDNGIDNFGNKNYSEYEHNNCNEKKPTCEYHKNSNQLCCCFWKLFCFRPNTCHCNKKPDCKPCNPCRR